jgi:hypothetical protein
MDRTVTLLTITFAPSIQKSRRSKVEAKVKVNAPAVDVATGKAPAPLESEAERAYLAFLSFYFLTVMLGGLALAGAVS